MPTLYVTKGLPASGKTTWAKELVKTSQGKTKRFNKDDLRAMIDNGEWSKSNEQFIKKVQRYMVERALLDGLNAVVDDTNLVEATFEYWENLAKANNWNFEVKDFTDVPVEICIARDQGRGAAAVGEKVIKSMAKSLPRHKEIPVRRAKQGLGSCILVDLDGTSAHMGDRRGPFEWKKVGLDEPDKEVLEFLKWVASHDYYPTIIYLSGRDGSCRPETEEWLRTHDFPQTDKRDDDYGLKLFMRTAGDMRSDAIVKRELFEAHIEGKYDVDFVLDDRDRVVDMWRNELGLLVFQVARGAF